MNLDAGRVTASVTIDVSSSSLEENHSSSDIGHWGYQHSSGERKLVWHLAEISESFPLAEEEQHNTLYYRDNNCYCSFRRYWIIVRNKTEEVDSFLGLACRIEATWRNSGSSEIKQLADLHHLSFSRSLHKTKLHQVNGNDVTLAFVLLYFVLQWFSMDGSQKCLCDVVSGRVVRDCLLLFHSTTPYPHDIMLVTSACLCHILEGTAT